MAITLPDIVQRVVLDTRRFSMGSKGAQKELAATASSAKSSGDAVEKSGKQHDRAGESAGRHESYLTRFNRTAKASAPSVLRLADNLYKVRQRHGEAGQAAKKHDGILSRFFSKLKRSAMSGVTSAAKFGAKWTALGFILLNLLPVAGALGGAFVALAGSMGRALGIIPALSGGLLGLVAVAASVMMMFSGVKTAMKDQAKAGASGAKTAKAVAKAQESGAKQIAAAQKQVLTASRAVSDARRAEAEAIANIAEVQQENARKVADATRRVYEAEVTRAEAMAKTWTAQQKLNASYEIARRNLVELRRENERANIAQQRSEIALRGSRQALLDTLNSGTGNGDEILSAMLDAESAELDALDATDALADSKTKLADAEKKEIANSDAVTEARAELAEAKQDEADANYELARSELDLQDTQLEAVKSVAEARQQAADATRDLADAVSELREAEAGVGEAQRDAAEGVADAADSGASSAASSGEKPSKEASAIAAALKRAKDTLKPMKALVQALTFRDVISGIDKGSKLLLSFKGRLGETAKIISSSMAQLPDKLSMVRGSIDNIWKANNNLIKSGADLGGTFVMAGAVMADAGSFILTHFAGVADEVNGRIKDTLANPDTFAKMQVFFLKALASATTWWHIIRDFAVGIFKVFSAGADTGDKMSKSIEDTAAAFRKWTSDDKNRDKMTDFFEKARDLSGKVMGFFGEIAKAIGAIATGPGIPAISGMLDKMFPGSGGKKPPLSEVLSALGNKAIVGTAEAIGSMFEVLSGKKEAGTNAEKIAVAFTDLRNLTDPLGTFADILGFVVDKIKWGADNIPGFSGALGGLMAVMVVGKVSKTMGLTGAINSVLRVAGFVSNQRNGLPAIRRETSRTADALGAPVKVSKWGLVNRIRGIRTESAKAPETNANLAKMAGGAESSGARVQKAGTKFGNFSTRLKTFVGRASGAGSAAGALGGAMWAAGSLAGEGKLADVLNKVGAALVVMGTVTEIATGLASLGKASQTAGAAQGVLAGGMAASTAATSSATASTVALNTAWYASPITWIIAALVALGAGLYMLYKKNETFRKFIDGLWQSMQKAWDVILPVLKNVVSWIKDKLFGAFSFVYNWVKDNWKLLAVLFGGPIGIAVALISTHFDTIKGFITDTLLPAFGQIWEVIRTVFSAVVAGLTMYWNYWIKPIFTAWVWTLREVVWPAIKILWAIVQDVFHAIAKLVSLWWNYWLKPIFFALKAYYTDVLFPVIRKLWDVARAVFQGVSDAVSAAWNWVKPILEKMGSWVHDKVQTPFSKAADKIKEVWGTIAGAVSTAFDGAKSALKKSLKFIGDMISPLLSGASKIAGAIGMDNLSTTLKETSVSVGKWGEEKAEGGRVGEYAAGHRRFGTAKPTKVGGGFKTGTPRAIVGEGSRHPEYVIPTDPKYRGRAKGLIAMAMRDISQGPTGRFGENMGFAKGGKMPEYGLGGLLDLAEKLSPADLANQVIDAARGIGANAIDSVWPHMPAKWLKQDFPVGIPGNAMESLRQGVIDKVKGEASLKGSLRDAASAAVSGVGAKGINPAFLDLFNRYNAASGNKFRITSGWRDSKKQAALYAAYLAGTGNLAAKPGTSNHERGLAIDHSPNSTPADRERASLFGLHYPLLHASQSEPWHVQPINMANPYAGANLFPEKRKGGLLADVPNFGAGGIVTDEMIGRIGELGKHEAVVPLDSPRGRRMLGDDGGQPSVLIDMRGSQFHTGDPQAVKAAVKEGVEEALDTVAELVENDTR